MYCKGAKEIKCIVKALKKVQRLIEADVLVDSQATDSSDTPVLSTQPPNSLFSVNETITASKLAQQICSNNGVYLNLIDEVERLFECLDEQMSR